MSQTKTQTITPNASVLDLLRAGGSLTLPGKEIALVGDVEDGYINICTVESDGSLTSEGLWNLSYSGFVDALEDAEKIHRERYKDENEDNED